MSEPARRFPSVSPEEYLEREHDAAMKHEFVDGVVYMMAGTSRLHNAIALAIHGLLRGNLLKPCEAFALDIKVEVNIAKKKHYFYPDGLVTCSERDNDPLVVKQPVLLIEVLSDSTRDYDRGEKFEIYRHLPSLQEYLLVEQDVSRADLFRRRTGWQPERYSPPDEVLLESVQIKVPISAFY
jgi:Uma2 family endonuclease